MADVLEFALANIARVEVVTEEAVPITHRMTNVASEADIQAYTSEGQEQTLRVKNTIKAQNKTEDIVMGYDINLKSVTMTPEILALVDGGTWDGAVKKYSAPAIGSPVERTPFSLKVYTEEKDTSGETLGYVCFTYLHCKGRPVNYSLKDAEFFSEELRAKSRPAMGESPVTFEYLESLPA